MAITRRQFVTRLGALAAAAGFSQGEVSKIMDAMAYSGALATTYGGTFGKPRVVWLHGAECTGCSTSLLSIFETLGGEAVVGSGITTADALSAAGTLTVNAGQIAAPKLHTAGYAEYADAVNIADVVVDVIDLLYHETIMGAGGDLAYKWLKDFEANNALPFVLVVEGALQKKEGGGAWSDAYTDVSWCSIAASDTPGGGDVDMPDMVKSLAEKPLCAAVIAIGQCATFGGYPGCKPPINESVAGGFNPSMSQTGALGCFDYLTANSNADTAGKVINVPGCPTNPWWFVLSTVLFLVDLPSIVGAAVGTVGTLGTLVKVTPNANNAIGVGINGPAVDGDRRLKAVYGISVHSSHCPRFPWYAAGVFAANPGEKGCLQKIGCKGPATSSLCGVHGWNGQQPENRKAAVAYDQDVASANPNVQVDGSTLTGYKGGHCTRAGHPCMGCTEHGYPDNFVPFVVRS